MKLNIKELKESESLKIIEVSNHIVSSYPMSYFEEPEKEIIDDNVIQQKVFTDGEIEQVGDITSEPINDYFIGEERYRHSVDTLKTKDIYIKNYSYVIMYTIAKELLNNGRVKGWFKVVKDTTIYVRDLKDKKALKSAKKAVVAIDRKNRSVDYSSIHSMMYTKGMPLKGYDTTKISRNVYLIRKTK